MLKARAWSKASVGRHESDDAVLSMYRQCAAQPDGVSDLRLGCLMYYALSNVHGGIRAVWLQSRLSIPALANCISSTGSGYPGPVHVGFSEQSLWLVNEVLSTRSMNCMYRRLGTEAIHSLVDEPSVPRRLLSSTFCF